MDDASLAAIERALLVDFDHRFGGFGSGTKFPHAEALDFALLRNVERRDATLTEVLTKSLSAMTDGELWDRAGGGFFRACRERDWRRPVTEKTLDGNVGLSRVLIGAGRHLDRPDLLEAGRGALTFVQASLQDPATGLLFAGLAPDDGYYGLGAAERKTRTSPRPDVRLLADANARAAVGLLRGGALLDDESLVASAAELMHRVVALLWKPGKGVLHRVGSGDPDHLGDMAECAFALLAVHEQTGRAELLAPLDDLLEGVLDRHVLASGELGDRLSPPAAGQSLRWTAVAAQALLRGADLRGRPRWRLAARRALHRRAGDHLRHGDQLASFGRAVALALRPPARVVVVGAPDDETAAALRRQACTLPLLDRVLLPLDPAHDGDRLAAVGLAGDETPAAHVFVGRERLGRACDAGTLQSLLLRAAVERRAAPAAVLDGLD